MVTFLLPGRNKGKTPFVFVNLCLPLGKWREGKELSCICFFLNNLHSTAFIFGESIFWSPTCPVGVLFSHVLGEKCCSILLCSVLGETAN
jgi:hypothetical protein